MKYFMISEAGPAIECHCNSERHLALKMENPSSMLAFATIPENAFGISGRTVSEPGIWYYSPRVQGSFAAFIAKGTSLREHDRYAGLRLAL
jgi:hypothetical protein